MGNLQADELRSLINQDASDEEIDKFLLDNNLNDDTALSLMEANPPEQREQPEPQNESGFQDLKRVPGQFKEMVTSEEGQEFLKDFGRIGVETAASSLAVAAAPLITPAGVVTSLGLRSLLAGAGAFSGSLISETFDPTEEPLTTAGEAGLGGVVGEGVLGIGGAIKGVAKNLSGPVARRLSRTAKPGAQQAQIILQNKGESLSLAQAVDSPMANTIQTIADSNPLGSSVLSRNKAAAVKAAEDSVSEFVDAMGPNIGILEIGDLVKNKVKSETTSFKAAARGKYAKLDRLLGGGEKVSLKATGEGSIITEEGDILLNEFLLPAPGITQAVHVDFRKSKKFAEDLLEIESKTESTSQAKGVLRRHLARGDDVSFEDAQILRSDLLSISRMQGKENIPGRAKSIAGKLAKEIDSAMEKAAGKVSGEAKQAWREANAFYKEGATLFNDRLIVKMAKDDPGLVFNQLVRPGRSDTINKAKKIILSGEDGENIWKAVQGQFGQETIEKATNVGTGEVSGLKLLKEINKFGGTREGEALTKIISKDQVNNFKEFAKALQLAESNPASKFRLAAQVGQVGAVTGLFMGGAGFGSLGVLLGPKALASVVTSPKVVNLFVNAVKLEKVGKTGAAKKSFTAGMNILIRAGAIATTRQANPLSTPQTSGDVNSDVQR